MERIVGVVAVVESGPAHPSIVVAEPEGLDQVEPAPCVDRETHEVAGVRSDLRFVEGDVEHGCEHISTVNEERRTPQTYRVHQRDPFATLEILNTDVALFDPPLVE